MNACQVCRTAQSLYTCPHCNVQYCSSSCYHGHGSSCTERFYRTQLQAECRQAVPGALERRVGALGGILRAGKDAEGGSDSASAADDHSGAGGGDGEAEEEELDTGHLLALALAVDAASTPEARQQAESALEAAMSPSALRAFHRDLAQGTGGAEPLGAGVTPWWVPHSPTPLPFAPGSADSACSARPVPPPLSSLRPAARGPPSPLLRHSALEVLIAYTHAYLLHNGELLAGAPPGALHHQHPALTLLAMAACLAQDARYATAAQACAAALQAAAQPSVRLAPLPSPALSLALLAEACAAGVCSSSAAAQEALLHAWACVRNGARQARSSSSSASSSGGVAVALALAEKKLAFLCAWAQEHLHEGACQELREEVLEVCQEGMAGLVGRAVAGQGAGAQGGSSSSSSSDRSSKGQGVSDLVAGRLLRQRGTYRHLPAMLKLSSTKL